MGIKSSYSKGNSNCVTIGCLSNFIIVWDSKAGKDSEVIIFNNSEWKKFINSLK